MKWLPVLLLLCSPAVAQVTSVGDPPCLGLTCTSGNTFMMSIVKSRWYVFEPKADITAYELGLAMKVIIPIITASSPFRDYTFLIDELPPEVKRHFKEETQ